MKKYIGYIGVLIGGILLGWLLFGGTNEEKDHNHDSVAETAQIWTCSMHPQIRMNEAGDCPICGMELILLSNAESINPMAIKMSPTAMQLANVQTAIVQKSNAEKTIRLNGKVQADERYVSSQTTHIAGRVERLVVNFTGETVTKGQVLAYVYSPELISAQKEMFEAKKLIELQPQLFESAKNKLKNWKLSENTIDQIISTNKIIENFPIRADRSGIVISKMVNLGEYLNQGSAIYEIADLSKLWVWFDVYERDLNWVRKGSKIQYSFNSYQGHELEGVIQFVEPSINSQTRTARARIDIKNKNGKYKPEMFVTGKVQTRLTSQREEIAIPKTAVMWTGERSIVYVKYSTEIGTSFLLKEVTLGESLGDKIIVLEGLKVGDEIVVNGTFSVDAAAQLAGKPSMMNPSGGKRNVGHNHGGNSVNDMDDMSAKSISPTAQKELAGIFDAYLILKNDLVQDDFPKSKESLEQYKLSLSQINMSLFKGDNHTLWMKHGSALEKLTERYLKAKDITVAREIFILVSEQMIMIAKAFPPNKELYIQYCPMADKSNGARWLSDSRNVNNPYFGESMLKCGEVTGLVK